MAEVVCSCGSDVEVNKSNSPSFCALLRSASASDILIWHSGGLGNETGGGRVRGALGVTPLPRSGDSVSLAFDSDVGGEGAVANGCSEDSLTELSEAGFGWNVDDIGLECDDDNSCS